MTFAAAIPLLKVISVPAVLTVSVSEVALVPVMVITPLAGVEGATTTPSDPAYVRAFVFVIPLSNCGLLLTIVVALPAWGITPVVNPEMQVRTPALVREHPVMVCGTYAVPPAFPTGT